ncbi:MAG TPA: alpha/beta fold hydrolase [Longimicrobium sp.]|nr:alpha/beta fold hydrolase [Longimicrobium sp.]
MRPVRAALAAALAAVPLAGTAAAQDAGVGGRWGGRLEVQSLRLRITLAVDSAEGGLTARFVSVDQGNTAIPAAVAVSADSVTFDMAMIGASYRAVLVHRDTLRGEWVQGGGRLPLVMVRGADAEMVVRRPQTPQPPFPYRAEEVAFDSEPGVRLAGTLTLPEGAGPHPAAFLITGSGPQDRDETLLGHKPFLVLADHLTRSGIAVLRVDDRGTGASTGSFAAATSENFARDAEAAVRFLRARPEVDAARVGLIGHSEGGLVAPLVASRTPEVAFVVLLAGPGMPGARLLDMQTSLIARAAGAEDSVVANAAILRRELFGAVTSIADSAALAARLREIGARAMATVAEDAHDEMRVQLETAVGQFTSPWFRWFLRYDPLPALRATRVPVLALNGALDLQVPPDEDLGGIERALREGGNPDVTVEKLPGLNHLFQPAATGAPTEYAEIEQTMAPVVLERVTAWILQRFGPAPR